MRDEVPSVAKLPTKWGQFDIHVYHEESRSEERRVGKEC